MEFNKKRSAGARERLKALQEIEPRSREIFEEARPAFRKDVARDDILDALVAAVTAYRGHGRLQTAPQRPPTDAKGLPMEIVYYTP
jgi:predicted RNase H-like nuclease